MSEEKKNKRKKPPHGLRQSKIIQSAKNVRVIEAALDGKTQSEIAQEQGLNRCTVSEILNHSDEAKRLNQEIESRFASLVDRSMRTFERVVDRDDPDSDTTALKAAIYIVERVIGKVPDKVHATIEDEFKGMSRAELVLVLKRELEGDPTDAAE
jgi:DNA-binding transcriptional regulator LsrR (DeoR family)